MLERLLFQCHLLWPVTPTRPNADTLLPLLKIMYLAHMILRVIPLLKPCISVHGSLVDFDAGVPPVDIREQTVSGYPPNSAKTHTFSAEGISIPRQC